MTTAEHFDTSPLALHTGAQDLALQFRAWQDRHAEMLPFAFEQYAEGAKLAGLTPVSLEDFTFYLWHESRLLGRLRRAA